MTFQVDYKFDEPMILSQSSGLKFIIALFLKTETEIK